MNDAIKRAAGELGNQSRLAEALGVSRQAVSYWARGEEKVPILRARQIQEMTEIPIEELCPETFRQ